jgi:tetratricopeptide (TPR) repeat protein
MIKRKFAAALLAALALGACASAQKRYDQGVELEERGRPADAAERYIEALKKEPGLPEARTRLQDAGDRAAADYLARSDAFAGAGQHADAADVLLRLDELRRDASAVGVQLNVPGDYAARRRSAFDRAIQQTIENAAAAGARQGDWSTALSRLERAGGRWQPSPAQRGEIDQARFDLTLAWAEGEMRSGRYRSAYDVAQRAALVYGRESEAAARALEMQEEALARGTIRAAVLPVGADGSARRKLPDDLIPVLNDALDEGQWSRPPLFVEVLDPVRVGREARRHGYARQAPTTREAALVGSDLGVELVVIAEIDSVAPRDQDVQTERRAAKTQAGADTAYTVRRGEHTLWARVTYALVDVPGRRVIQEGTVAGDAGARFRKAEFTGDWRTLRLTREERDLFDPGNDVDNDRELVRDMVRDLSERLGRDVYAPWRRASTEPRICAPSPKSGTPFPRPSAPTSSRTPRSCAPRWAWRARGRAGRATSSSIP